VLERIEEYRKQRQVWVETRHLYAELSGVYRRMGELYRELRTVYWQLKPFCRGSNEYIVGEREAGQARHKAISSELAELRLQAQNLSAAITNIQHTKPAWTDFPEGSLDITSSFSTH
jgi:hypothetical protein